MIDPKQQKRLELARKIIQVAESNLWKEVLLPYIEQERQLQIENMASQTDAMQLMRYAGAAQALGNLLRMESQARTLIELEMANPISGTK